MAAVFGGVGSRRANVSRVDLGQLAAHDPLALEIKRRVLGHRPDHLPGQAFSQMWGTIVVVRRQGPHLLGANLRELTLRFDYGHLIIHDGRVGRPDISLWGADADVLSLGAVQLRTTAESDSLWRAPARWWAAGRAISRVSSSSTNADGVEVFGALAHPRLLYRLALVLSPPRDTDGLSSETGERSASAAARAHGE